MKKKTTKVDNSFHILSQIDYLKKRLNEEEEKENPNPITIDSLRRMIWEETENYLSEMLEV